MAHNSRTAIVGIGCRFPGGGSPEQFWDALLHGVDSITEVPEDRWTIPSFYSPQNVQGKARTKWGGFVEDIGGFDAEFFGISPREAELMDPQQRLLLEVVHEAFEDAGMPLSSLAGQRVGVYVGGFTLDYMLMQLGGGDYQMVEPHTATGSMMTLLANRISYVYGFNGPSVTVDTACSSSLTAAHLASRALRGGECDIAVAAGVNAMLTPAITVAESRAGMLSPTGRSRAFDSRADGYVRGEGAGAVILRPAEDARTEEQRVYALVRSSAVNQDGHSDGLTVPSGAAQQALIRTALAQAGVEPAEVAFVEAHGTGTPVGDPIEANAIGAVVREGRDPARPCYLGSVKTNIGHLEAAAGIAGLIKASLELFHGCLPPHLHMETPNPEIDLDELRLAVPRQVVPLRREDRFACVNSFGFGGSNAHVVLERPDPVPAPSAPSQDIVTLLPLSAKTPEALDALTARYAELCHRTTVDPGVLAATAATRRDHHPVRRAVVGATPEDFARELAETAEGGAAGARTVSPRSPLVFVYSGMGPQWAGMGQELYASEPEFRAVVDEIAMIGDPLSGWPLASAFTGELPAERMEETEVAQPANFALQVGLTALWRSWGVRPDYVVGHSAGEPAAAHVAGVLSLADATRVSYARSITQQRTSGKGKLMAVGESLDALRARLARSPERRIDLAAVNSPNAITVVGDGEDIQALARELESEEVFHRFLNVKVPYHSFYMEDIEADLLARVEGIVAGPARTPIVSTVAGALADGPELDVKYWYRNVREPVRFQEAVEVLLGLGASDFLEIGPHPVLTRSILETADALDRPGARAVSSLRRETPERETLLRAAAELYAWGCDLDWPRLRTGQPAQVALPTYAWQRRHYWHENTDWARRVTPRPHPFLRCRVEGAGLEWEADLDAPHLDWLADHRIEDAVVFPGAGYGELALWAGREAYGDADRIICQDLRFHKALYMEPGARRRVRLALEPGTGTFTIRSQQAGNEGWTTHAAGRLSFAGPGVRFPALGALDAPVIPSDRLYAELADLGLRYGPEFRVLRWLRREATEAVAHVQLSAAASRARDAYVIHPLVMDAGFQVLALAALAEGGSKTFMPVEVAESRICGEVPAELMIRATVCPGSHDGDIRGDIHFYDLDGKPVLQILGCRAQDIQASAAAAGPMEFYTVAWPAAADPDPAPSGEAGAWALVGDHPFTGLVGRALERAGATTHLLPPGLPVAQIAAELAEHGPIRGLLDLTPLSVRDEDGPEGGVTAGLQAMHDFQACAALTQSEPPRIWLLTQRAQPVLGEVRNSLQATVWGVGRVGGQFEQQSSWGGLVDVDDLTAEVAARVATHVLSGDAEDQVAFYAGTRHVPRIRPVQVPPRQGAPFRRDCAYLVTGGLGGLGLDVARWMVAGGARHLVLVGRRGLPPREEWSVDPSDAIRAVKALEADGASVEVYACDVSDVGALQDLRDRRDREGRVPIRGVIHSAGTSIPQLLVDMGDEDFRSIALAKVHGGWALDQVFPTGLDLFVVFSSVASLIVSAGQTNYAAGNAYLDALVFARRSRGEPALSIDWGPWSDVGMATQLDLLEFFVARGLQPTTSAQGTRALGQLLASELVQVAPFRPDWVTTARTYPLGAAPAMLDDVCTAAATVADSPADARPLEQVLAEATPEERPGVISDEARAVVASVLRYPEDDLVGNAPLTSLGLDSMLAMELKGRVEQSLRVNVPIVSLLKGSTLDDLILACQEQLLGGSDTDDEIEAVLAAAAGLDLADLVVSNES